MCVYTTCIDVEQLRSLLLSVADPTTMRFIWPEEAMSYLMGGKAHDEEDPGAGSEK